MIAPQHIVLCLDGTEAMTDTREREQVMDRYQVVTLQAAVYVVDNDEMQASRFAGDWNAHASCELLNSGAMPRTDLDWIDLEPESGDPS